MVFIFAKVLWVIASEYNRNQGEDARQSSPQMRDEAGACSLRLEHQKATVPAPVGEQKCLSPASPESYPVPPAGPQGYPVPPTGPQGYPVPSAGPQSYPVLPPQSWGGEKPQAPPSVRPPATASVQPPPYSEKQ